MKLVAKKRDNLYYIDAIDKEGTYPSITWNNLRSVFYNNVGFLVKEDELLQRFNKDKYIFHMVPIAFHDKKSAIEFIEQFDSIMVEFKLAGVK